MPGRCVADAQVKRVLKQAGAQVAARGSVGHFLFGVAAPRRLSRFDVGGHGKADRGRGAPDPPSKDQRDALARRLLR